MAFLLAVSLLTATYAQLGHHAYTNAAPKKLYLLHFHEQAPGSEQVVNDELHLLATDPVPVQDVIDRLVLRPGMDPKALLVGDVKPHPSDVWSLPAHAMCVLGT